MKKEEAIKVGNTSFNIKAVKAMKKEDFVKTYEPILKGQNAEEVYKKIVGEEAKAKPEPKAKPDKD